VKGSPRFSKALWLRGVVFTVLVPGAVGFYVPFSLLKHASLRGGGWAIGWLPIAVGTLLYGFSLIRFLLAGGTPAIFFTRHLRVVIGEEPAVLEARGPYRFSRNPMYLGVVLVVLGQASLFASKVIASYGLVLFLLFHGVVVLIEEPHLRAEHGARYKQYCGKVPRWFGPLH
jgi:protein-S-isoprenylcysteine O-methyltransferase Ste14